MNSFNNCQVTFNMGNGSSSMPEIQPATEKPCACSQRLGLSTTWARTLSFHDISYPFFNCKRSLLHYLICKTLFKSTYLLNIELLISDRLYLYDLKLVQWSHKSNVTGCQSVTVTKRNKIAWRILLCVNYYGLVQFC